MSGALVVDQAGVVQSRAAPFPLEAMTATGHRLEQLRLAWLIDAGQDSADTRDAYGRDSVQYLRWCEQVGLDPLTVALPDATMYAGWLAMSVPGRNGGKPYAQRTRRRKIAAISSWYTFLHRSGAIGSNPWRDVRRPSKPEGSPTRSPALELIVRMLDAALQHDFRGISRQCAELILVILAYIGVRASEVCNLRLDDFARDGRSVTVREKGGKVRIRPVPAELRALIVAWLVVRPPAATPEDAPYLLLDKQGRRLDRKQVWRLVKRMAVLAKVPEPETIKPHGLRHAFNDLAKALGFDIEARRDALGHRSTETTELYTHVGLAPEDDPVHAVARAVQAERAELPRAA